MPENNENMSFENDFSEEEALESNDTTSEQQYDSNEQNRVNPLNQIASTLKGLTSNLPKLFSPKPAMNSNNTVFPKLPLFSNGNNTLVQPSNVVNEESGYGFGGLFSNLWFVILLQVIIILFLIKWLFLSCFPCKY